MFHCLNILDSMPLEAKGYLLCELHNSSGYSKPISKIYFIWTIVTKLVQFVFLNIYSFKPTLKKGF